MVETLTTLPLADKNLKKTCLQELRLVSSCSDISCIVYMTFYILCNFFFASPKFNSILLLNVPPISFF